MGSKLTTSLWFDANAEEAVAFYVSVFPDAKITGETRYPESGPGEPGAVMEISYVLAGMSFMAINGGPMYAGFTPTVSIVVNCVDQAEIDHYWAKLTEGGEEMPCGWAKDRFGFCWQIVPARLPEIMKRAPDPVMKALLQMKKLDIAALEAAAGD